jgi:hypothetical protein
MDNLYDILETKHIRKSDGKYAMYEIANDLLNLLQTDSENYFDITGFSKDFFLSGTLSQEEKQEFYTELKKIGFFKQLNNFLYSEIFSIASWTIYTIGKFSNNENAGYLETAYETSFKLTNSMLSYRCLSELDWLNSIKIEQYLTGLESDKSIFSKLILLYYWEIRGYSSKFKDLLADKELLNFIAPSTALVDIEEEICDRLFAFENNITDLYNTTKNGSINKYEFEDIAKKYFKNYSKAVDKKAKAEHLEFLKKIDTK